AGVEVGRFMRRSDTDLSPGHQNVPAVQRRRALLQCAPERDGRDGQWWPRILGASNDTNEGEHDDDLDEEGADDAGPGGTGRAADAADPGDRGRPAAGGLSRGLS